MQPSTRFNPMAAENIIEATLLDLLPHTLRMNHIFPSPVSDPDLPGLFVGTRSFWFLK